MSCKSVIEVVPSTKQKKLSVTNVSAFCLLCKAICSEQHTYTQKQWDALKLRAKEWSGLDRGFVYSEVDYEKGTRNEHSFFHRKCTENVKTQTKLLQAKSRKKNWLRLHRVVYYYHQIQVLMNKRLLCQYHHLLQIQQSQKNH